MTRVILDEMVSPNIVKPLIEAGVDATCVRDRGLQSASDPRIWRFAQAEQRTVVTGNIAHFERLAGNTRDHHGVIGLPPGGTRRMQFDRVMAVIDWSAREIGGCFINMFAYLDTNGIVRADSVSANDNVVISLLQATANQIPN